VGRIVDLVERAGQKIAVDLARGPAVQLREARGVLRLGVVASCAHCFGDLAIELRGRLLRRLLRRMMRTAELLDEISQPRRRDAVEGLARLRARQDRPGDLRCVGLVDRAAGLVAHHLLDVADHVLADRGRCSVEQLTFHGRVGLLLLLGSLSRSIFGHEPGRLVRAAAGADALSDLAQLDRLERRVADAERVGAVPLLAVVTLDDGSIVVRAVGEPVVQELDHGFFLETTFAARLDRGPVIASARALAASCEPKSCASSGFMVPPPLALSHTQGDPGTWNITCQRWLFARASAISRSSCLFVFFVAWRRGRTGRSSAQSSSSPTRKRWGSCANTPGRKVFKSDASQCRMYA
jgi:hypothetical protein